VNALSSWGHQGRSYKMKESILCETVDAGKNEMMKIAKNCRHCAMCKVDFLGSGVCASGLEKQYVSFYPEGRMDLYAAIAENAIPVTEKCVEIADSCTLCGKCDYQCYFVNEMRPSKVMKALKDYVDTYLKSGGNIVLSKDDEILTEMKKIVFLLIMFSVSACVAIPKETATLSQTLGTDLKVLHNTHRNMVTLYFEKIKNEINSFVNDVYSPFIINYVLKSDLKNYQEGNPSLFGAIEIAGKKEGKEESENALKEMSDFLDAARRNIETKRNELISPINTQQNQVLQAVDQSYENAIYANSTITGYLESVQKVKAAQKEALSMIGMEGADTVMTNNLVKLSDQLDTALKKGKEIDIKSDNAYNQFESIIKEIKNLTNKK